MITPQDKLKLMRLQKSDPAAAILTLAEMLSAGVSRDIEKSIAAAISDLRKEIPNLKQLLETVRGADGKDADPKEVAKALLATPGFLEKIRPKEGPRGLKGDSVIGPAGPRGPQGRIPVAGIDFPKPKDGRDGYTPVKGKDYFDGESIEGPAGKDGSPDKPLEIAAKLNTTEESVDMSVIKGLEKWMRSVNAAIKERPAGNEPQRRIGGGGNIVEYKDLSDQCNGVTRTFTLPSNRRVLSVHSTQFPQTFSPGTDWTSVGRTLTLSSSFDPIAAGQTLYIIYVH